jgi:hypothetical protein
MSFKKEYRKRHRRKVTMKEEIRAIFDKMTKKDWNKLEEDIERFKDTPNMGILIPQHKGRKRK